MSTTVSPAPLEAGVIPLPTSGIFKMLPLSVLVASKTNPRKTFHEESLQDLAKSVAEHGVLEPVIVRPLSGGRYELVAGERRYRASKLAKREEIPAMIKQLTDIQALEIQVIENQQRDDIHPLEEAIGYKQLLDAKYDLGVLADKVSKTKSYVYQRLSLLKLNEEARKLFLNETLNISHAIQLARLQPKDQAEVIKRCVCTRYGSKDTEACGPKEMADFIAENIMLKLARAQFKKDDPTLVPAAGACPNCSKRTGASPLLFPDIKENDICTDSACFKSKEAAHVLITIKGVEKQGEKILRISDEYQGYQAKPRAGIKERGQYNVAEKDSCATVQKGIYIDSDKRGKVVTICADKECKKHFGRTSSPRYVAPPAEVKRQKAEDAKRKRDGQVRLRIMDAIIAKSTPAGPKETHLLAAHLWRRTEHDYKKAVATQLGWPPVKNQFSGVNYELMGLKAIKEMTTPELWKFFVRVSLTGDVVLHTYEIASKRLFEVAAEFKVDTKKIGSEVAIEIAAAEKKKTAKLAVVKKPVAAKSKAKVN